VAVTVAAAVDPPTQPPSRAAEPEHEPDPQPGPDPEPEPEPAAAEEASADADVPRLPSTEPVAVQRPRLAEAREPVLSPDGTGRSEKARHALADEAMTQPPPAPARAATPAWLDDYDDDADVTQSMNLKTPPPVPATSVRDRRHTGDNILPRK
jgi:hypothetical protein